MSAVPQFDPKRLREFEAAKLAFGSHDPNAPQKCAMEWVAYVRGLPHSDAPPCVSPSIRRFVIRLNDRWSDEDRQTLKPYLLRCSGTTGTPEQEQRRRWMLADFACRVAAPIGLDAIGATSWAELLRSGPEILDPAAAGEMESLCQFAAAAAIAAAAAAAAIAAAAAAAIAAAAADADDDADDADDAAADADDDAAADADDARATLRAEALALLDRLISVTEAP